MNTCTLARLINVVTFFYVSPTLIAPHHGKVDLDGRPRDVGVYEGSTIIILLGDKIEGELKLSPA